jgi:Zn-finger nucleic acid-binding protein
VAKKEACPKCTSEIFAKAEDASSKRYCSKCRHVWVPGFDGLKRTDLLLKQAQEENIRLKDEIIKLRKQVSDLVRAGAEDFEAIHDEM